MSVENLSDPAALHLDPPPDLCFYCGKPLPSLVVYWHGASCQPGIAFHPDCAEKFGRHLIEDWHRSIATECGL